MSAARGIVIAAPASGQGKTVIAAALMRALIERGLAVAPAKIGPDYIDPSFHARAARAVAINLDLWALRDSTIAALLHAHASQCDLVICEAVMGLFDGIDAHGRYSSAELARRLDWPVVLVVDARGQGASIAALVEGFARHRADTPIVGVILNRVGGARHEALLRAALVDMPPVLGAVPRDEALALPERHLGLVPAGEFVRHEETIARAASLVSNHVDLDALCALARPTTSLSTTDEAGIAPLGQRVAVARDDAFVFAYPWMLEAWRRAGATVSFFAPLADEAPAADSDAIFLPGGYPELHAGKLAAASRFKSGLANAARTSRVIYGECGGYMVLGEGLVDAAGDHHAMLGLLPLATSFATRRLHLGYREIKTLGELGLAPLGATLRGHEFHYATILEEGPGDALFAARDANGNSLGSVGRRIGHVAGSFIHLIDRADSRR